MEQIHHFELERSNDGSNWTMLNASISPVARSYDDTEIPAVGSSFYYRLTGKTSPSNLDIPYNIVSLPNPGPDPGICLLQRMFGGTGTSGDGCVTKKIRSNNAGEVIICGTHNYNVNYGSGPLSSLGGPDSFLAKYSANGEIQWSVRWGHVSSDSSMDCAFDSQGNIIVLGFVSSGVSPIVLDFGFGPTQCAGGSEVFLLKLTPAGGLIFFKTYGGSGADGALTGMGLALDSSDNIYITGTHGFFGTGIDFGGGSLPALGRRDMFLAKLDSSGQYVAAAGFGGPDSNNDEVTPTGMAIHSSGVYVCGKINGTANMGLGNITSTGGFDGFLAKYSLSDLSAIWVKHFSGISAGETGDQSITCMSIDPNGNPIVAGEFTQTIVIPGGPTIDTREMNGVAGSLLVAKYTSAGGFVWQRNWQAQYNAAKMDGVTVDILGEITFCGQMITGIDFGTGWLLGQGGNDAMLVHLNSSGTVTWARRGAPYGNRATAVSANAITRMILMAGDNGANNIPNFHTQQIITTPGTVNNAFWTRWSP